MTEFDEFGDDRGRGAARGVRPGMGEGVPRLGQLVNWAGALVSLGLVVGMAVWAFQLTMRDVSGVPVIRALEGPMRVPPADPGGTQAAHQGLAVNRLAEGEEAAPVPDRLVLAPPPVDLTAIALTSASIAAPRAPEAPEMAEMAEAPAAPAPLPTPAAAAAETQALIERLMARADPIGSASAAEPAAALMAPDTPAPAEMAADVIPASVPGVARSLRPPSRPVELARFAPVAAASAAPATPALIDPASLSEGTRLVQLGAFDTPEIAMVEWDRLTARFPDYFAGRAPVIEAAASGGSAFYRLRAHGFDDLAASRRFCAALMAQNAPCIPVTVR